MRALVYFGQRDARVVDMPEPGPPPPGQLLIKVRAAAFCGTDASEWAAGPLMVPLRTVHPGSRHRGPVILGHEFTGTVVGVGAGVPGGIEGVEVVPGAGVWCGKCRWCADGRVNLCASYHVLGLHAHGGMAELATAPAAMCREVPAGVAPVTAALAQPLAIALHAARRSQAGKDDVVLVIGAGGIGMLLLAALRGHGVRQLIALDVDADRLRTAAALGATATVAAAPPAPPDLSGLLGPDGADVVIECSGTAGGVTLAFESARRGGRVHLVGIPSVPVQLTLRRAVIEEVDVSTSNGHVCDIDLPAALELLADSEVAAAIPTHVVDLDHAVDDALQPLAEKRLHSKPVVRL